VSVIEGERVVLRSRCAADVPYARAWYADPGTTRWLLLPYPKTAEGYDVPAEPATFADVKLTIVDRESDKPIGYAGLVNGSPEHRRATAFLAVGDAAYRGKGYGADALRALCRFGFDTMNLAKVELEVVADNERAVRTYERLGFVREVHRRRALWTNGAWRDEYLMGVLPGELR
jgi:RimJ/RimL family protein N-acetyltransferase